MNNSVNESRRCVICNHSHFLEVNVTFQPKVCDGYHDFMQKVMSFNDFAIVSVKANDYKSCFWHMTKYESINIIQNFDLKEESGSW